MHYFLVGHLQAFNHEARILTSFPEIFNGPMPDSSLLLHENFIKKLKELVSLLFGAFQPNRVRVE